MLVVGVEVMDSDIQTAAENYFLSSNFSNRRVLEDIIHVRESYENAWLSLDPREKDQAINDELINPKILINHPPKKPGISSFPKLRVRCGQKIVQDVDQSTGQNIEYRDEHSSPFAWRSRSQQDLNLDLEIVPMDEERMSAEGLQLVAARRSAILSCPFGQYSRIPKSSIPVSIPQVPNLHRSNKDPEKCPTKNPEKADEPSNQTLEKASEPGLGLGVALERYLDPEPEPEQDSDQRDSNPRVEDAMISSIVVSSIEDTLVLDFSKPLIYDSVSAGSSTPREDTTLLARMKDIKEKTLSLKRSLTPTMRRRRKSNTSIETGSTMLSSGETGSTVGYSSESGGHYTDSISTLSSEGEITPTRTANKVVRAVSCSRPSAPPPPPPSSQPSAANPPPPSSSVSATPVKRSGPPRPPTRNPETRISSRPSSIDNISRIGDEKSISEIGDETPQAAKPVEIPKTGFDFLDEW